MRVTSIQTIEYLKVHLAYDGIKTGLLASLRFLAQIISKAAEQTAAVCVALVNVSLVAFAFMKVGEAWSVTGYCCDVYNILPFMAGVL